MSTPPILYEDLSQLHEPIQPLIEEAFRKSIKKGQFILGEEVEAFEQKLSESTYRDYAIGLSSGTAALTLLLKAMKEQNDRRMVVLPAMVCMPVVAAVVEAGCEPIFVDVSFGRYTIDPDLADAAMNDKVLALIAVHLYGHVCELDRLKLLCERDGAYLLEDCAQAQGALWKGKPVGSFGDAAAFSFYPTKHLGALGDAGAAVTSNSEWAEYIKKAREYGSFTRGPYSFLTGNYRMDTIQAAILLAKWPYWMEWVEKRNTHARLYLDQLIEIGLELPKKVVEAKDAQHVFPVLSSNRNRLTQQLLELGIETAQHYSYVSALQPVFKGKFISKDYPVACKVANEQISLTCSAVHKEETIEKVIKHLKVILNFG
jgi:dTDP-4-amino-4,6-dideoxygalactose transaminase